jgi:protein-S-isoprenylcysteine O-methyltransferase
MTLPREFHPGGERSLAGIALRAFLLGLVLGISLLLAAWAIYSDSNLWRIPFFLATLSLFHFLEFWTTAQFNPKQATLESFLLTNGKRYQQAHTFAMFEALVTSFFLPGWQSAVNPPVLRFVGLIMIVVGQTVRTLAMVQAGSSFNHQVQSRRSADHLLVTTGMYGVFRHPAYFGFFWWGLGTQVVMGNAVSFIGYAGVLWWFFKTRIQRKYLGYLHVVVGKEQTDL